MKEIQHLSAPSGWKRQWATPFGLARLFWITMRGHSDGPQKITQFLGHVKGPLMKIGQIASIVPDLIPAPYAQALSNLQAHAPPMGWPMMKRRLQKEWGPDWMHHFQWFEQNASFAASLGQVHKACLIDGQLVACKIQYPKMEEIIDTDLKFLRLFCYTYEKYGKALKTESLQEELGQHLKAELDYQQEARHLIWFGEIFKEVPLVRIAKVIPKLSTGRLLTMTWLEGRPFQEAFPLDKTLRDMLAKSLFLGWYKPFYQYGLLHADPHFGNYTFQEETLNIMDFGCVRKFSPQFIGAVLHLYYGLLKSNKKDIQDAYHRWGFQDLDDDTQEALTHWAKFLYGPLLDDRVRPIDESGTGHHGKEVALNVHRLLRKKGGLHPPKEFVFMDRAAVGIGSALIHLKAEQNWHQLFEGLIEEWSEDKLLKNQQNIIEL